MAIESLKLAHEGLELDGKTDQKGDSSSNSLTFQEALITEFQIPSAASKQQTAVPGQIEYPNLSIYVPESGDTMQSIASRFGITEEALAKANNLNATDPIPPRIQLKIPEIISQNILASYIPLQKPYIHFIFP